MQEIFHREGEVPIQGKRNGDILVALTREAVIGLHQLLWEDPLLTSRVSNCYTFQSG
jgi:hypothetical protein